jgi:hypothetical protein
MVFQLQFWTWFGLENLVKRKFQLRIGLALLFLSIPSFAAENLTGAQYLRDAAQLYKSGAYFKAARYAFAAAEKDPSLKPDAYAWMTMGLLHAGLPNSASYFFIRTLQSGRPAAVRSVLTQTQELITLVGADVFRKYLIRHTRYEDYDSTNRSAYLYALGKDALISGDQNRAIGYLNGIDHRSPLWPFALQLRASAYSIQGKNNEAIEDFQKCENEADRVVGSFITEAWRRKQAEREADDLRSRCIAGRARTLYQMNQFAEADRVYDHIPKRSFVWPDILFEQAWNSFGKREYNRTLGKLVSYKSPALSFLFNTEVEVLRAQSYLALCLYSDANESINDFNAKYTRVGEELKRFVEENQSNLNVFYDLGKSALRESLYTRSDVYRLANRFVRGPYFQNLVASERQLPREAEMIRRFDAAQTGVTHSLSGGFPGFLDQVLRWRLQSIQILGGAFVKNSLMDYHAVLIDDFEKMAFIKLEMLKFAKEKLMNRSTLSSSDRSRGNVEPSRRDDQYRWSFNGEFWNDELGDYVFGLESECKG